MDETIIVTYSPKYKAYQQKIRGRQIERALKMMLPDKFPVDIQQLYDEAHSQSYKLFYTILNFLSCWRYCKTTQTSFFN